MANPTPSLTSRVLGNRAAPDLPWLTKVTGCSTGEAEAAVSSLEAHSRLVDHLASEVMSTGRAYYAQFPAPIDLFALVRITRPVTVVESGVASGISSAFILMGLKSNRSGTLRSIDYPVQRKGARGGESWAIPQGRSSGWAVPGGLRKSWDLHIGRSEDLLKPLLAGAGGLDFYCHDSPVDEAHFEFEMKAVLPHLRPGSLVVADNIYWGTFRDSAESVGATAVRRGTSHLGAFRVPARAP